MHRPPYFQFFTGKEFFQHAFPHERSDLSHWRKRLGDKLELLLADSLRVARPGRRVTRPRPQAGHGRHRGAAEGDHLPDRRQAVACGNPGTEPPGEQARRAVAAIPPADHQERRDDGGPLRPCQTVRRHRRQLRILRSQLGRIIRDIRRKIEGQPALEEAFCPCRLPRRAGPFATALQTAGSFILSMPGDDTSAKARPPHPYEFGVKASIVTNNRRAPGDLFVLHAGALPD